MAITLPHPGIPSRGINTPLTNMSGSLTIFASNIIFEGRLVGNVESRLPKAEKQTADKIISRLKVAKLAIPAPKKKTPTVNRIEEITMPYKNPAKMSPEIMAETEAGVETSRSRVLFIVSQGAITGVAEEAIKKSVMPSRPGKRVGGDMFLPNTNAQKRQTGKKMPKIKTGGLR